MKTMDYEKIKSDKIQEARDLYERLGIDLNENGLIDSDYFEEIPMVDESTDNKGDVVFHWTRLSNTSNVGYIAE